MNTKEKIQAIMNLLQERGEAGTAARVAQLLGVSPSTVSRWLQGQKPSPSQDEKIAMLLRTLQRAKKGDPDAKKITGSLLAAAGAGLLGLGIAGILIAAGLGWILSGNGDEDEKTNE